MESGEQLLDLIENDRRYKLAYIKAYDELAKSMPGRINWINQRVVPRLGDVIPMGLNKRNQKVYYVMKNAKLDDTKHRNYNVVVFGPGFWCQCYMHPKYGDSRRVKICSHVGAVMLYQLMEKYLKELSVL